MYLQAISHHTWEVKFKNVQNVKQIYTSIDMCCNLKAEYADSQMFVLRNILPIRYD